MAHVFISYAREDLDFAEQLANRLQRTGLSVWWDRSLLAGADIEATIDEQIRSCSAVIVIWSSTSINSHWVRSEASAALELDKMVPVRSDETRLPRPFDQIHTLDLSTWKGGFNRDIRVLFDSVRTISKGKKIRRGPGKTVGTISRGRMVSIGALASAAVVGLAIVSDLSDLLGNLSGQKDEHTLNEKLEKLDDRLARMDKPTAPPTVAIDEIYLRDSLRLLQTLNIPVDDLVIEMAKNQSFEEVVNALRIALTTDKDNLPRQRQRDLRHQLAALIYQADRAKSETIYQAILDQNQDDFGANFQMANIYINRNDPANSALFIDVTKRLPPPNRASELELEMLSAFNIGLGRDYVGAADLIEKIRNEARDEGLEFQYSAAVSMQAMLLVALERHDEAKLLLEETIDLQESRHFYNHFANSLISLARIEYNAENLQSAEQYLQRYMSISEALQRPGYLSQGYTMLGQIDLDAGRLSSAEDFFSNSLAIAREHSFSGDKIKSAIGLAQVSLARDDASSACRYFNLARNETSTVGSRAYEGVAASHEVACQHTGITP